MSNKRNNYALADPDYTDELANFFEPGGRSALRTGRRIYPCPTCGKPNRLTKKDVQHGYQCDECADLDERGY